MPFKSFFLFLLLLLLVSESRGQSIEQAQVLSKKLSAATLPQEQLELTIQLAEQYISRNDSLKKYALFGLQLARQLKNELYIARAEQFLAAGLIRTDPDSSHKMALRSLTYFKAHNDIKGQIGTNNTLGNYEAHKGSHANARQYYLTSLEKAEQFYANDNQRLPRIKCGAYINISNTYLNENNYEKAIEYVLSASKTGREAHLIEMEFITAQSLGNLHMEIKQMTQAEMYYKEALSLAEKVNIPQYKATILSNLSAFYIRAKKLKEAKKHLNQALQLGYQLKDYVGIASRLLNLSAIETEEKKYIEAILTLRKALDISLRHRLKSIQLQALTNLAQVNFRAEKIPDAVDYANKGIALAQELNNKTFLTSLYGTLQNITQKQQDYSKALTFQEKKYQLKDSLLNEKTLAKIQELQTKYETEKKQRKIEELSRLNRIQSLELNQRNLWIALTTVLLSALALAIFFIARQRILKEQNRVLNINQQLLRSQINPHFFFNVLSSIQTFLMNKQNIPESLLFLSKFSKLMRSTLENSRVEFIPLDEELNDIKNYLEVQKIRFGDKFDYDIEIMGDWDIGNYSIPPMLLQPFLENALEHGIQPKTDKGWILIKVEKLADRILLMIIDDGVGRQNPGKQTNVATKSLATVITQERIDLLNKKNNKDFSFEIIDLINSNSKPAGTQVIFSLPLIEA